MPTKKTVQPKVALITGAARRIGAEIANILHENGINVVLHYHTSKKDAEKLCATLNQRRINSAMTVQADLSKIKNIKPLMSQVIKKWGYLDVLVNNASCFYKTSVNTAKETQWDTLLDTNLKASFFLSQAAIPHLKKRRGCIINIADIHASRPLKEYAIYSISKAGLIMLTQSLARELGPEIRVNAVSPGAILWPEATNTLPAAVKQKIIAHIALKRHGDPSEIAKTVLFLVQETNYITGQNIAVDGGRSLFL